MVWDLFIVMSSNRNLPKVGDGSKLSNATTGNVIVSRFIVPVATIRNMDFVMID